MNIGSAIASLSAEHIAPAVGPRHAALVGTSGADRIAAPGGTFWINALGGPDTIVLASGTGRGTAFDFERGIDRIAFNGIDPAAVKVIEHEYDGISGELAVLPGGGHLWMPGLHGASLADLTGTASVSPTIVTPPAVVPVAPTTKPVIVHTPETTGYPTTHVTAPGYTVGAGDALVGAYVENQPENLARFDAMLGRPADGVLGYIAGENWEAITSPEWIQGQFAGRPLFLSVPLIPEDGTQLEDAYGGTFYPYYKELAERYLAIAVPAADGYFHVRTGWELNGDWFQWAAEGKELAFNAAFQPFADAFHNTDPRYRVEWNTASDLDHRWNPELAFPGKEYVDIIGHDFYWNPQWTSDDPVAAFNMLRDVGYGLAWTEDLAARNNLPTAYSEWGVPTGVDASVYLALVDQWFAEHDVVQHTVWDSNSAYAGMLSDGSSPASADAYRAAFGSDQYGIA